MPRISREQRRMNWERDAKALKAKNAARDKWRAEMPKAESYLAFHYEMAELILRAYYASRESRLRLENIILKAELAAK